MRTTIKDVAHKSGVSVSAVSLVLNNKKCRVADETRKRIIRIAEELQYRPNHLARGLVTRKTHTIGLIVPDMRNYHFAEICKQVEHVCRDKGYIVIMGNYGTSAQQANEYFNVLIDKGVEGIIFAKSSVIYPSKEEQECYKMANLANVPIITFEPIEAQTRVSTILFDYKLGGYIATKHLLNLGHRNIGCITGPSTVKTSLERLEGYKMALKEQGIPFDPRRLYEGNFEIESGMGALPTLRGEGVTAIFSFNDMMALGVYKAAHNYNLNIPNDFSIIGFDDIFLNDILEIPLTSILQPSAAIGRESAEQIIKMINHDEFSRSVVFQPVLKVRASTSKIE